MMNSNHSSSSPSGIIPILLSPSPLAPPSSLPTDRLNSQAELYPSNQNIHNNNNNFSNNTSRSPSPNRQPPHPQSFQYQQQQQQSQQGPGGYMNTNHNNYVTNNNKSNHQQQQQQNYQSNQSSYNNNSPVVIPLPLNHYQQSSPQPTSSNQLATTMPTRRGALSEAVPMTFSNEGSFSSQGGSVSGYQQALPGSQFRQQPRSTSASGFSLDLLSLNSQQVPVKKPLYATPEDGPPFKLSVVHPDQKTLAVLRERAATGGVNGQGDIAAKVAWSKQVLKFIERHQSSAGASSRIDDPVLVRWTDEALNHILTSASSSTPIPLALYLRGDLSSSGSFPSYRPKDPKAAFRDFESAANQGYEKAWFRIGRAYEEVGDQARAIGAYEKGMEVGDCGSTYRMAMANLLGQIGLVTDFKRGVQLVERAADLADLDTPQPPYILGMLLTGEFESPAVQIPQGLVPLNIEEAKSRIERSAYLSFGPAQYKMGFSYEYATLSCLFDPLLSVQYYALASQNGEVEADMALSKWYLCGSEGNFEKNEALAVTFAEKAAGRSLPSAEFALGYYREVGINGIKDLERAKRWYARAAGHGNADAQDRLVALAAGWENALSRSDHESQVDIKLIRKRTQAQARSNEQRDKIEASNHNNNNNTSPNSRYNYSGGERSGGRQSVDSATTKMRRRDTMRQVEVAAVMNMLDSHGIRSGSTSSASPLHPRVGSASSASSTNYLGRPSYQLSDTPSSARSTMKPVGIVLEEENRKPESFADMGIVTQKAKKDECLMM